MDQAVKCWELLTLCGLPWIELWVYNHIGIQVYTYVYSSKKFIYMCIFVGYCNHKLIIKKFKHNGIYIYTYIYI